MALFKKSTDLDALRQRAEKLALRHATATSDLQEALDRRQRFHLEGDIDDTRSVEKLENAVVAARSRVDGLTDAIGALQTQISEREYQLKVEHDAAARKVAAEKLTDQLAAFEQALTPMLTAMRLFADSCEPLSALSFEAAQMMEYIAKVASEVEVACAFVAPDMRLQVEMVASGERQAPREKTAEIIELQPVVEQVTATSQGEETVVVFATAPIKWRDRGGNIHHASRFSDAEIPRRLHARATQKNVVTTLDDPRRRELKGSLGGFMPDAAHIVDLDSEKLPLVGTPVLTPLPVGEPYEIQFREPRR
jgi:hypothetical protein